MSIYSAACCLAGNFPSSSGMSSNLSRRSNERPSVSCKESRNAAPRGARMEFLQHPAAVKGLPSIPSARTSASSSSALLTAGKRTARREGWQTLQRLSNSSRTLNIEVARAKHRRRHHHHPPPLPPPLPLPRPIAIIIFASKTRVDSSRFKSSCSSPSTSISRSLRAFRCNSKGSRPARSGRFTYGRTFSSSARTCCCGIPPSPTRSFLSRCSASSTMLSSA
mmetsp:Transcript_41986/g.132355  ORF Transcript_41986/g.132355 Transcript_41986/m.132355 type:complete len:222 (+) Transcript_41986:3891-4556(+)